MTEHWVVNASPLIAFGSIARLDLLSSLAVVPDSVADEVLRVDDDASRALAQSTFRIANRGYCFDLYEPDIQD